MFCKINYDEFFSSNEDVGYTSCTKSNCSNTYRHLCIDIETRKTWPSWKYPECQAKLKKDGDNSSTPLRTIQWNVTIRKPLEAEVQCFITIEEIRTMIKEEIRSTIKESFSSLRTEINNQLRDFRDQLKYFKHSIEYFNDQFKKFNAENTTYYHPPLDISFPLVTNPKLQYNKQVRLNFRKANYNLTRRLIGMIGNASSWG